MPAIDELDVVGMGGDGERERWHDQGTALRDGLMQNTRLIRRSVHLRLARADAAAEEIELHVGMIGQQRHRHRGVGNRLEIISVVSRRPNGLS